MTRLLIIALCFAAFEAFGQRERVVATLVEKSTSNQICRKTLRYEARWGWGIRETNAASVHVVVTNKVPLNAWRRIVRKGGMDVPSTNEFVRAEGTNKLYRHRAKIRWRKVIKENQEGRIPEYANTNYFRTFPARVRVER